MDEVNGVRTSQLDEVSEVGRWTERVGGVVWASTQKTTLEAWLWLDVECRRLPTK